VKKIAVDGWPGLCHVCGKGVFWIETQDGKTSYDRNGKKHERTCRPKGEKRGKERDALER
jgi:hypothetical protein